MPSWRWRQPTEMAGGCKNITANSASHLFTFLEHPEAPPGNNASERELRPTATYRKVTGGFRSHWGADLFAAVRSVIGTAARRGIDAYQATHAVLDADSVIQPG
jgi:transposase